MFSSNLFSTLYKAVGTKRPHGTQSVEAFTRWLCTKLPKSHTRDTFGNVHLDLRGTGKPLPRTLFVAHVDTVHHEGGKNKYQWVGTKLHAQGAPLGADDGAGVAMLMHLIQFQVPGYYIFTQGEERGGLGAKHLLKRHADLLRQFDRAIAFDRRGTDSIITYQGGNRCCSDAFADHLADQLNSPMNGFYSADSSGVYTDTAEFVDLIPECTNISVGYDHEHSDCETLDLAHFEALSQAVLMVPWETLPVERDPSVFDSLWRPSRTLSITPAWPMSYKSRLSAMARETMIDMAYTDPEMFVDLVRDELGIY